MLSMSVSPRHAEEICVISRHVKQGRTKKTHGLNIAESVYASVYVQSKCA